MGGIMGKVKGYIKEFLPYIIILIIVLFIKVFIATPIRVNGPSMNDTLRNKDIMILDEVSYKFSSIERFDIVVIKYKKEYLIKRVVGLPGERIRYEDNKLYINGKYVKEDFEHKKTSDFSEVLVPSDKYFVMGDNRVNSVDSRMIGTIDRDDIKGKTSFVLFPFSRFGSKK